MAIDLGRALGGMAAAFQGQAPQYQQQIRQEDRQAISDEMAQTQYAQQQQQYAQGQEDRQSGMQEQRQKAMYQDFYAAGQMMAASDMGSVVSLLEDRLDALRNIQGADPADTQIMLQLAKAAAGGDQRAAQMLQNELQAATGLGVARGYVTLPDPVKGTEVDGSLINPITGEVMYQGTPDPGYRMLTPQEVAEIPGADPTKPWQINLKNNQRSMMGGSGTVVNVGTATEGERTAGTLANRLDFAMAQINDVLAVSPAAASPGVVPSALSAVGLDYLANISNDADRQIVEAAQMDMLDAALTLGTGAAYTKEQLDGYRKSYFPQLGDKENAITAKRIRLENLIRTAYDKAGRAAPPQMLSNVQKPDGIPEGSRLIGKTPEGVDVWQSPDGKNWTE